MQQDFAIFTKTYKGDRHHFARLCESMDKHMPEVTHYVLVDHSDLELFAHYASDRRQIVDCQTILPQFFELDLPRRRLWWKFPAKLVRGWIYQQLIKIGFTATLKEQAVMLVDSDVTFLRPITTNDLYIDGRVKFYRAPDRADGPQFEQWHRIAQRCLGVPETGYPGFDYIIPAIPISPEVMRAMIDRIENVSGKDWAAALYGHFRFSEYVLYGNFVDKVAGPHQDLVHATSETSCHCSWDYDLDDQAGLDAFADELAPHHNCVVLQSNLGLPQAQRDAIMARLQA